MDAISALIFLEVIFLSKKLFKWADEKHYNRTEYRKVSLTHRAWICWNLYLLKRLGVSSRYTSRFCWIKKRFKISWCTILFPPETLMSVSDRYWTKDNNTSKLRSVFSEIALNFFLLKPAEPQHILRIFLNFALFWASIFL